ncbi:xanthine dehydrogenase-like [Saccostrea echinata]|uniref:xanthine dehydrogenase-like n=1 Tax=Saccostrea echinata TaxID=191078 RepID=UPI002A805B8D|nr:xanthine dehydrogenase-like [Saccostrea echinata]
MRESLSCPVCSALHIPQKRNLKNGIFMGTCQSCGHFFKFRCSNGVESSITVTVNGKSYSVGSEYSGSSTLNSFLRDSRISMGTKYMCKEGGCGTCLVQAKLYEPITMERQTYAVNSCLVPLFSCDGWEITTIEGIDSTSDQSVPKRLAQYNGSQCGFCSPGQVMNIHALLDYHGGTVTKQMVEDASDSVICRCTGFRSILDAMKSFAEENSQHVSDIEDVHTKRCDRTGQICTGSCHKQSSQLALKDVQWFKPTTVEDLIKMIKDNKGKNYRLVFGNTGYGVYKELDPKNYDILIDLRGVTELYGIDFDPTIVLGSSLSLSQLYDVLNRGSNEPKFGYFKEMCKIISKVATASVRNLGTWAGNLMLKHKHPEFQSDIYTMLEVVRAQLNIVVNGETKVIPISEFLSQDMTDCVIVAMFLNSVPDNHHIRIYKVNKRTQSAHSDVNAGMNFGVDATQNFLIKSKPTIVFGGISKNFVHATKTEEYLVGKALGDQNTLKGALTMLSQELIPDDSDQNLTSADFRKNVAMALFYRFVLDVLGNRASSQFRSGSTPLTRPLSSGRQTYDTKPLEWPLTEPMTKVEAVNQASGRAVYINDIAGQPGECFAAFVLSTEASAKIQNIDPSEALAMPGVLKFIAAKDIPGINNVSPPPFPTEEVLVSDRVEYYSQPIGILVAESQNAVDSAVDKVKVTYTNIQPPILTMEDAIDKKSIFPKVADEIKVGDAEGAIAKSAVKVTGRIKCGTQYHMAMETQITICNPTEDGFDVYSSTQWVDRCQKSIAMVLGIPDSSISVSVRRLGGAYGSKISRNFIVAAGCALASNAIKRPVRLSLDFHVNMKMVGKRFPWMADYTIGLSSDGMLEGVKITYYTDCGINPIDNSLAGMVLGMDNGYYCPNWHLIPVALKTNTACNTSCRSPGSCPTIFIMESIMEHCAKMLDKDPTDFRRQNLYKKGQVTPAKMPLTYCNIRELTSQLLSSADYVTRQQQVSSYNQANRWKKKGLSVVPMKFGIDWTGGNYTALVAIHGYDGSVSISHGGIESGQGINTKVIQVCATTLGIPMDIIRVKPTDSLSTANSVTTGGSITSELCCKAVLQCCDALNKRIAPVKQKMAGKSWKDVIFQCFSENMDLSERYWEVPNSPNVFQYNSYGVTLTEVTLDVLTGQHIIDRVDMLFDCGESMNPEIDIGQCEGAFVMGLGYFLLEEIKYDQKTGQQLTDGTWEYKVPLAKDIPVDFRINLLKNAPNPVGILRAKACGEPPLCMSCSALFAIKHAVEAFRRDIGKDTYFALDAPATVEKVQQACMIDASQFVIQ